MHMHTRLFIQIKNPVVKQLDNVQSYPHIRSLVIQEKKIIFQFYSEITAMSYPFPDQGEKGYSWGEKERNVIKKRKQTWHQQQPEQFEKSPLETTPESSLIDDHRPGLLTYD